MSMLGMARRLAVMESRLCGSNANGIVFIQMSGESRDAMEERIARWYQGEKVEGQERMYEGGNPMVVRVVFLEAPRA